MKEAGKGNDGLCSGRAQLASVFYDTSSHFITLCKKTECEQILSLFFLPFIFYRGRNTRGNLLFNLNLNLCHCTTNMLARLNAKQMALLWATFYHAIKIQFFFGNVK